MPSLIEATGSARVDNKPSRPSNCQSESTPPSFLRDGDESRFAFALTIVPFLTRR